MTDASIAAAPTNGTAAPAGLEAIAALSTPEQRISALKEHVESRPSTTDETPANGTPAKPAAPETEELPAHVVERRKRLAGFAEKERAAADARAKNRVPRPAAPAAATVPADTTKKLADAERVLSALKDPVSALQLLEESGHAPHAVAEALKAAMIDPSRTAALKAKDAVAPYVDELKKEIADLKALRKEIADERETGAATATNEQNHRAFISHATTSKTIAPLAARFAEKRPAQFIELANELAKAHPNPASLGAQGLLDLVEEELFAFQQDTSDTPSVSRGKPPPPPAPAQGRAPTNRTASDRATVTDPDAEWSATWDGMSTEDRIRHIKAQRQK